MYIRTMKIFACDRDDYEVLAGIWERSVRATHDFLREEDFAEIKNALIPDYFPEVNLFATAADGVFTGFIGLRSDKIEMLFIDPDCHGKGYGTALIDFAKPNGAMKVDVNEQNTRALEFYLSKGFRVIGRKETDDSGRPYPILKLSL